MALPKLSLNLTARQEKLVKLLGLGVLAIVTFLFTLHVAFPYDRLKGKLIEVLSEKYDVRIASAHRGLLPGEIVIERLSLTSRPESPEDKPSEFVVDRLEIDLGLDFNILGAIRQKAAIDFAAELGAGVIEGELDLSKKLVEVVVETDGLPLETVPGIAAAVGLPMTGSLDLSATLRLPGAKWKEAEGKIELSCNGCTIGDGVSKLTFDTRRSRRGSARAWDADARSLTVPKLSLGDAEALVDIKGGVGEIKTLAATSPDGWLKITGKLEFNDPFSKSLFPGCMQFKLSDELKKREPSFGNIEFTISEKLRQADGSFAMPTKGTLTNLKWDLRSQCGGGSAEQDDHDEDGVDIMPSLSRRPALEPTTEAEATSARDEAAAAAAAAAASADRGKPTDDAGTGNAMPAVGASGPTMREPRRNDEFAAPAQGDRDRDEGEDSNGDDYVEDERGADERGRDERGRDGDEDGYDRDRDRDDREQRAYEEDVDQEEVDDRDPEDRRMRQEIYEQNGGVD